MDKQDFNVNIDKNLLSLCTQFIQVINADISIFEVVVRLIPNIIGSGDFADTQSELFYWFFDPDKNVAGRYLKYGESYSFTYENILDIQGYSSLNKSIIKTWNAGFTDIVVVCASGNWEYESDTPSHIPLPTINGKVLGYDSPKPFIQLNLEQYKSKRSFLSTKSQEGFDIRLNKNKPASISKKELFDILSKDCDIDF